MRIAISNANVVRVLWHPKINQIITGSSNGAIHVLYSPHLSTRGATLSLSRTARVKGPGEEDIELDRPIITPHALPMYKTDEPVVAGGRGGKRKRERERQDPVKTLKPMPPLTGPGRGGRVGASATQHVVQGLVKDSIRHEDVSLQVSSSLAPLSAGRHTEIFWFFSNSHEKPYLNLQPNMKENRPSLREHGKRLCQSLSLMLGY